MFMSFLPAYASSSPILPKLSSSKPTSSCFLPNCARLCQAASNEKLKIAAAHNGLQEEQTKANAKGSQATATTMKTKMKPCTYLGLIRSSRLESEQYMAEAKRSFLREQTLAQNLAKFDRFVNGDIGEKHGQKRDCQEDAMITEQLTAKAQVESYAEDEKEANDDGSTYAYEYGVKCKTSNVIFSRIRLSRAQAKQVKAFQNVDDEYTNKRGWRNNPHAHDVSDDYDDEESMSHHSLATSRAQVRSQLSHTMMIEDEDENDTTFGEFVVEAVAESFCSVVTCKGLFSDDVCFSEKQKNNSKYYYCDDDETCFTAATGCSTVATGLTGCSNSSSEEDHQ